MNHHKSIASTINSDLTSVSLINLFGQEDQTLSIKTLRKFEAQLKLQEKQQQMTSSSTNIYQGRSTLQNQMAQQDDTFTKEHNVGNLKNGYSQKQSITAFSKSSLGYASSFRDVQPSIIVQQKQNLASVLDLKPFPNSATNKNQGQFLFSGLKPKQKFTLFSPSSSSNLLLNQKQNRGTISDFFNSNMKSKYERAVSSQIDTESKQNYGISRKSSQGKCGCIDTSQEYGDCQNGKCNKQNSYQQFKPYVAERNGMGKLISVVSLNQRLNHLKQEYEPVKTIHLPSVKKTERYLEKFVRKQSKGSKIDPSISIADKYYDSKLQDSQQYDQTLILEDQTQLLSSNIHENLNRNIFKIDSEPFELINLQSQNNPERNLDSIKSRNSQFQSQLSQNSQMSASQQPQLSNRENREHRKHMISNYHQQQQKLILSTANIRSVPHPNLKQFASESLLHTDLENEFQKSIYSLKYEVSQKKKRHISPLKHNPNLYKVRSHLDLQSEKVKKIMSQRVICDSEHQLSGLNLHIVNHDFENEQLQQFEKLSNLKNNKYQRKKFKPQFNASNKLQKLSSDQLLLLTTNKIVPYLNGKPSGSSNNDMNKQRNLKISQQFAVPTKENNNAKNMLRENQGEFHKREWAQGLSQVALEKPQDAIMDTRLLQNHNQFHQMTNNQESIETPRTNDFNQKSSQLNNPQVKDTPIFAGIHSSMIKSGNRQSNYNDRFHSGASDLKDQQNDPRYINRDYDQYDLTSEEEEYQKYRNDGGSQEFRQDQNNSHSFKNSHSENKPLYKSNNSFNNSQLYNGEESSKLLRQVLNVSGDPESTNNQNLVRNMQRYSEILGQQSISDLNNQTDNNLMISQQDQSQNFQVKQVQSHMRQGSQNSINNYQNLQNMNEYDLEEFLKSTNSAVSDYNFLFENIDQQLHNNTQMMAEELQRNMPDYLMNTNSSLEQRDSFTRQKQNQHGSKDALEGNKDPLLMNIMHGGSQDSSFNRSIKDNRDMPRIMTTSNSGRAQNSLDLSKQNADTSMGKSAHNQHLDQKQGNYQQVNVSTNFMEQSANMSSQIDITDMSDGEIISIEDTYRETNAACKKSIEQTMQQSVNRGNKSMTIIEEEDYEESEILNNQSTILGMMSQNSLKLNTLKKSTSSNLNRTKNHLNQSNSSSSQPQLRNDLIQGHDSNKSYNTSQHYNQNNLRDSYETFGGAHQSIASNHNFQGPSAATHLNMKPNHFYHTANDMNQQLSPDDMRLDTNEQESFNLIHQVSHTQNTNQHFTNKEYLESNKQGNNAYNKNFATQNANMLNVGEGRLIYQHYSDTNNGPTAAATLDGGESKTVTLRSPLQHNTINHTNESNVSTLTHGNVKDLIDKDISLSKKVIHQFQNITIEEDINQQNFGNPQNNLGSIDYDGDRPNLIKRNMSQNAIKSVDNEKGGSISDMLQRYQEKYRKQKEESQQFNFTNQTNNSSIMDRQIYSGQETIHKEYAQEVDRDVRNKQRKIVEDSSDGSEQEDEQQYVNRSFVSTNNLNGTRKSRSRSNNKQPKSQVYEYTQNNPTLGQVDSSDSKKHPFQFMENTQDKQITKNLEKQVQSLLREVESYKLHISQQDRELQAYVKHIQDLEDLTKHTENQKLKLEKQLLTEQLQFDQQQKIEYTQFQKELKIKQSEIEHLLVKIEEQQQLNDQKLENQRERMKRVEKTVYERVEQEYSQILNEKDQTILDLQEQVLSLEHELRQLKDQIHRDQAALEMRFEEQQLKERQRIMEEREDIKYRTYQESDKELKKLRERMDQDYQFKYTQLEQKYKQKLKQLENMNKTHQNQFIEEKNQEFESLRHKELSRFEEEKLINHARTTQIVYEDVSKVLITKAKEEEKQKLERAKQKVVQDYEEKMRKLEAQWSMQIAQERKQRSKVELKNAQLEQQVYELMDKFKNMEYDKENTQKTANTTSDNKELINKLKKLNKTIPIK
eukprot:403371761